MKRALIQYAAGEDYDRQLTLTHDRNTQYCRDHNAEFLPFTHRQLPLGYANATRRAGWHKLYFIIQALKENYNQVIWLDTDTVIRDVGFDLFNLCGYGVGMTQHVTTPPNELDKHLNTGVMFIRNSPATLNFFKRWEEQPDNGHAWMEQKALHDMMTFERFWRDLITIVPNSFNGQPDVCPCEFPIIRAFHGMQNRTKLIESYLEGLKT